LNLLHAIINWSNYYE